MRSSSERETSPSSWATHRRRSNPLRHAFDRWGETQWGGHGTALVAILTGAAVLRFVGIQYGLPFGNLLNPDEQSIVPRSWEIVHGGGGDPHWFDYPTLLMYVNAPLQALFDEPSYLSARIVGVVLGLGAVAASWWLGRSAFGTPTAGAIAAATVAVCTIHVAYSRSAVTDVPLTLGVAIALTLMVKGRLELAGVAVGIAMGFKYPGIFLLVPLVVAGWRQWRRLGVSAVLAGVTFLATSPFILVHAGEAWDDLTRVQRLAREGWLGFEHDHPTPVAFVDRLWEGLGPMLIVAAVGLVVALVLRTRTDLILASFVLVYFLDLLTLDAHFDRYVLPLVPALGALAGRFRTLAPVTLLLLVVPLTWSIRDARELTRTDTRIIAHRWIEQHVPPGTRVAVDPSTPRLDDVRTVRLELPGPGREPDPNRDVDRLRGLGVENVFVTGAVTDRVLAARSDYPREAAFYDELRRRGERIYYLEPGEDRAGPWVAVYRLR
jgi:hypothetical protein